MAVIDRVEAIVVEQLGVDEEAVTPEARLAEDLGADEIHHTELIMACEEEFGVLISDEEAARMVTVQDLATAVQQAAGSG